jgi:hypothetical protein
MRNLPEKLQEFQRLVIYMAAFFGYSPMLFKLAKAIRGEVMEANPWLSAKDLTDKSIKAFDENKSKWFIEYNNLKKSKYNVSNQTDFAEAIEFGKLIDYIYNAFSSKKDELHKIRVLANLIKEDIITKYQNNKHQHKIIIMLSIEEFNKNPSIWVNIYNQIK